MTAHKHAEWIKLWADGEALEYRGAHPSNAWVPVPDSIVWGCAYHCEFRLAKTRLRYRVALMETKNPAGLTAGVTRWTTISDTASEEASMSTSTSFIRWLTDWTEYEA